MTDFNPHIKQLGEILNNIIIETSETVKNESKEGYTAEQVKEVADLVNEFDGLTKEVADKINEATELIKKRR